MFNRVSSNILLKSIILVMSAVVVLVLAAGAMDAWRNLRTATRLADVAEVSSDLFRGLSNLRLARALTPRALAFDGVVDAAQLKQIEDARGSGNPALQSAARLLPDVEFEGRDAVAREFGPLVQRYLALDKEAAAEVLKPKAQRRADLGKEIVASADALIDSMLRTSTAIDAATRNRDAFMDQMMILKDAAWLARLDGGEISVAISNALAGKRHLAPEAQQTLQRNIGHAGAGFDMMDRVTLGVAAGSPVRAAIEKARTGFYAPEFVAKR
ncbi:hypothetical protein, partial [Rhodoplanes roseus]